MAPLLCTLGQIGRELCLIALSQRCSTILLTLHQPWLHRHLASALASVLRELADHLDVRLVRTFLAIIRAILVLRHRP